VKERGAEDMDGGGGKEDEELDVMGEMRGGGDKAGGDCAKEKAGCAGVPEVCEP